MCRDESGGTLIIKDNDGWQGSPCVKCHCVEGNISCQKTITVFFPAYSSGIYEVSQNCSQPSCNILHFLTYQGHNCEGMVKIPLLFHWQMLDMSNRATLIGSPLIRRLLDSRSKCQDLSRKKFQAANGNRAHDLPDTGWNALWKSRDGQPHSRLIDWLIDRLIDRSIDRLIDWLVDWLIDWVTSLPGSHLFPSHGAAVHVCHCQGDRVLHLREVLARPRAGVLAYLLLLCFLCLIYWQSAKQFSSY